MNENEQKEVGKNEPWSSAPAQECPITSFALLYLKFFYRVPT